MKREIQVCDRCGASAETVEEKQALELVQISLATGYVYTGIRLHPSHPSWSKEWCLKCRTELGILPVPSGTQPKDVPEPPSLEDMIREIVREEISQQGQG
jgi:hypothetical protein